MQALGLGDIYRFPFIDRLSIRPSGCGEIAGRAAGHRIRQLTPLGQKMAHTCRSAFGRDAAASSDQGCLAQMLVIVSTLAVQDVRERPIEKAQAADTAHEMFVDEHSDFAYLNLWRWIEQQRSS